MERFTGLYLVSRCRSRCFLYFYYRSVIESTVNLTDSLREFKSDFGCVHGNVKFNCRYLYFTNSNIKQYCLFLHTPFVIRKWKKNRKKITQGNENISTAKKRLVLQHSFKIFIIILYRILLISSAVIFQVPRNYRQLHVLRLLINSTVNHELNSSMTRVYARFRKCVSNRWVDSLLPVFEKFWNIKKKKKILK